jgi:hypothetical protein
MQEQGNEAGRNSASASFLLPTEKLQGISWKEYLVPILLFKKLDASYEQ